MEGLSDEFILSGDDILDSDSIFDDNNEKETQDSHPEKNENSDLKNKETTEDVEVDPDNLFHNPEGVGSEEDNQEKENEDTTSDKGGTSSKTNFYSSIASALKDEGILPDLDDETVSSVKTPEDFAEVIEKQIQAKFDERQKRIDSALNANVEPDEVRQFESTLNFLDSLKEEHIADETEKGEELRKRLIFQDFINRGYSKERATREVKKSFDSGTDIEDAKEALESNREYFNTQYQEVVKEAQEEIKAEKERIRKEAAQLKKSMLEDKEMFEGIELDKMTRQKAFDNITKPIYKTEEGEYLTAIQKYEAENPVEFRKYLSILFTMTDGFKNLDTVVKGKVKKEVKQSLRELEHKLSSPSRATGNPRFVGMDNDKESYLGKGWELDLNKILYHYPFLQI